MAEKKIFTGWLNIVPELAALAQADAMRWNLNDLGHRVAITAGCYNTDVTVSIRTK